MFQEDLALINYNDWYVLKLNQTKWNQVYSDLEW